MPGADAAPTLPAVHAELEALTGDAFRARAAELVAAHPRPAIHALLLRAGRTAPPALTGGLAERRAARRAEALEWIAAELAVAEHRGTWWDAIRELMERDDDEQGVLYAALNVLGRLRRYELARDVAFQLDAEVPRVREAARATLFSLYGRRFADRAAFEALWPRLVGRDAAGAFVDELIALQETNDRLELALLERDPTRAAELLRRGHASLRARAAKVVGRAVGQLTLDPEEAIRLLTEQVSEETDAAAFHAILAALLELLRGAGHDAQLVVDLREHLQSPEVLGRTYLAESVVHALANLPWSEGDFPAALRMCAERLGVLADPTRPVDYERLHVALQAFGVLAARSGLSPRDVRAEAQDAGAVVGLLTRGAVPDDVRLDAAAVFPLVAGLDPLPELLDVLSGTTAEPLQFALLGTLQGLVDPRTSSEHDERLLAVLRRFVTNDDVDLRGRALTVLDTPALAEVFARSPAAGELRDVLLQGLSPAEVPAVQAGRMAVLRRFPPDGALLDDLLARPDLDALLDGNHRRPEQMVEILLHHAGGDVQGTARAARRVAGDLRDEPPPTALGAPQRALLALGMIERLGERAWDLTPEDHAAVVAWARRVRREAGGDSAGEPPELRPHLRRIVELHLPASAPNGTPDPHAEALFRGDLFLAAPEGADLRPVRDAYERAARAALDPRPVLRDRARFLWRAGQAEDALTDYRALVFPPGAPEPVLDGELLTATDLSRVLRGSTKGDGRAVSLGLALLERESWRKLGTVVRHGDLCALLDRAADSADPAQQARVAALFEDLPPVASDEFYEDDANLSFDGRVYDRLLGSRETHAQLAERVRTLREAIAALGKGGQEEGANPGG